MHKSHLRNTEADECESGDVQGAGDDAAHGPPRMIRLVGPQEKRGCGL